MITTLSLLIDKVKTELLDNPTIPDKSVEAVFAELRKIGKGNAIAALVQYTKLFTKEDAQKVYDLFAKLRGALEASIKVDEEKE
jgi:hypothetical protein